MGVYDQAARWAAQAEAEAVVGRLLRGTGLALRFREWVSSRTTPAPGETDRTADQVAALGDEAHPDRPWLLLVEFQSAHDPEKLDITLQEAARLRVEVRHGPDRQHKYRILTALVYLRGRCPEPVLHMTAPNGQGTRHAPVVWDVEADEAGATLEALAQGQATWGVLFWIPLMHGADDPGIIARWRELASALPTERLRGDLARIALIFAELAGRALVWRQGMEGWNVTESPLVNSWIETAEQEARLEEAREFMRLILETRFSIPIPEEVLGTINAQPSRALLVQWSKAALTASSLEEVIAVMRR